MKRRYSFPNDNGLIQTAGITKADFIASFAVAILNPLLRSISNIADIVYSKMIAARLIVGIVTAKPASRPYKEML